MVLFRIHTEDQPHQHLVGICQSHNYIGDAPRIAFRMRPSRLRNILNIEPT
jgi:hypothetical protein